MILYYTCSGLPLSDVTIAGYLPSTVIKKVQLCFYWNLLCRYCLDNWMTSIEKYWGSFSKCVYVYTIRMCVLALLDPQSTIYSKRSPMWVKVCPLRMCMLSCCRWESSEAYLWPQTCFLILIISHNPHYTACNGPNGDFAVWPFKVWVADTSLLLHSTCSWSVNSNQSSRNQIGSWPDLKNT